MSTKAAGSRWPGVALAVIVFATAVAVLLEVKDPRAQDVTVYMSPHCGCCGEWVDHLANNGFSARKHLVDNLDVVKARQQVPTAVASCHTAVVDGYFIEGHVPAADIRRLLGQRPSARGLAAPGMPAGAPGMESAGREPYDVLLVDEEGRTTVFAKH